MTSPELDYLAELMADFPVSGSSIASARDAEAILHTRYQDSLDKLIGSERLQKSLRSWPDHIFVSFFEGLAKNLHGSLFAGILSNSGHYRQTTDPRGGVVYFGPQRGNKPLFTGTSAVEIEKALQDVFLHLSKDASNPIASSVTFYQQFVRVHPFYDANGRIGRLLVSLYLDHHGFYINWDDLQRQDKWINRLNDCHKRQEQPQKYEEYLGYLVLYFSKYVSEKSSLEL